jgi:hypothetical protein
MINVLFLLACILIFVVYCYLSILSVAWGFWLLGTSLNKELRVIDGGDTPAGCGIILFCLLGLVIFIICFLVWLIQKSWFLWPPE